MNYKNLFINKFSRIYNLARDVKLIIAHKSMNPSKVVLPSGHSLFVNWHEPRGHAILRCNGNGQPYIKNIWSTILYQMKPEIVLDCGANYGELIFSTNYNTSQIAYAFEADPALVNWLKKSYEAHPDKNRIKIIHALLGSESGHDQTFYVDKKWSGRSTALKNHGFKDFFKLKVPTISLDDIISKEDCQDKGILFKIDVEGYEPFVLKGMKNIISLSKWQVGIIEFNLNFFNKIDFSPEEYINSIHENFEVALVAEENIYKFQNFTFENLKKTKIKFNDILVYSKEISKTINSIINFKQQ